MHPYIDLEKIFTEAASAWPENRIYCLADHAGMPGLLDELKRQAVVYANLFKGSREERALEVAPLLFALDAEAIKPRSFFLQWLAEHGTYTSSMLLMSSPLSLAALTRRRSQRLNARVSDEMDVLLRYFDPRTFEALLAVLTGHQRGAFLGVADCWWYLDRGGMAVRNPSTYEPVDTLDSPLVLTAEQEFGLLDASEPDQVSGQLKTMMPDHYLRIPLPQQHAFLVRHMKAAGPAGIRATHELALYCGLSLLYGEDFAGSPQWQAVLERVRSGVISLSDAVAHEEGEIYAV